MVQRRDVIFTLNLILVGVFSKSPHAYHLISFWTINRLSLHHLFLQSYGAEGNRLMGIPGEDLHGVFSAKDFVGWYNGLPSNKQVPFL